MSVLIDPAALRQTACELAKIGGVAARRLFGKVSVARKADNSPVTEADHVTQDAILRALAKRYPLHAIVVEETVAKPERHVEARASDYCWVIDPIDGTRNFGRGVRIYATSVAVLHRGRPVAGAIYDATSESVYSAAVGLGARRDETPLIVQDRAIDRETAVAIGSFRRHPAPAAVRGWMDQYLLRNQGSTSLHIAWVASGLVDAAYANDCKLWDIAAAALLVEEAGGLATGPGGEAIWPIDPAAYNGVDMPVLAAAPTLHRRLLADLRA